MISGIRQARVWVLATGTPARLVAPLNFRVTLYKMKAAIPVSKECGVRGGSTLQSVRQSQFFCSPLEIVMPSAIAQGTVARLGVCHRALGLSPPIPERGSSCCSHHLSGLDHFVCSPGNRQPSERRQGLGISWRDVRTPTGWPKSTFNVAGMACHLDGGRLLIQIDNRQWG